MERIIDKKVRGIFDIFYFFNNFFNKYLRLLTSPIRTLPDFLIIGAQRCGTTSLYNYLIRHPSIIPAYRKEVHFFDFWFNKGINWYKAFFPSLAYIYFMKLVFKHKFITGEATPNYIFYPHICKRIFSIIPRIKIIIMLRNPVDRAYSHYFYMLKQKSENLSIEEALKKEQERISKDEKKKKKKIQTSEKRRFFY